MPRASTLTASRTGRISDARPHAPRPSAWPVIRQSVVKVAETVMLNLAVDQSASLGDSSGTKQWRYLQCRARHRLSA